MDFILYSWEEKLGMSIEVYRHSYSWYLKLWYR